MLDLTTPKTWVQWFWFLTFSFPYDTNVSIHFFLPWFSLNSFNVEAVPEASPVCENHWGRDDFSRMTDDGFHSQTLLLFDQVGVVELVVVVVGLGSWFGRGLPPGSSYTCSGFDNMQTSGMSGILPPEIPRTKDDQQPRLPARYPGRGHVTHLVFGVACSQELKDAFGCRLPVWIPGQMAQ